MASRRPLCSALLILLLGVSIGVQAQMKMRGDPQAGRLLFHSSALSANGLACVHCHADFDEERRPDGLIRAGHSLDEAATRQTWWGQDPEDPDHYTDVAQAAVVCVEVFMLNPEKLSAQQTLDLQAYLEALARRPVHSPLAIAAAVDKTGRYLGFDGGDRIEGRRLFYAACHTCHPNGNAGIAPTAIPRDKPAAFYARRIREGNGMGAVLAGVDPNAYDPEDHHFMPFFAVDRLSNNQVRDLIAFVQSLPPPP